MDFTQAKGNITELQCISKFFEFGIECSVPYGNGAKYDFIADINGDLIRVQCKASSKIDDNSFMFNCRSQTSNTQKTINHRYSKNEIDYFATYYLGNVYLVPVEECSTAKTLRLAPPKNNKQKINLAEDYEIQKVLLKKFNVSELEKPISNSKEFNKKKYYCSKCGKNEVSQNGNYCIECSRNEGRIVNRPSRKDLKEMVRNKSFTSIGNEYGVSDKAVVRWCEYYKIPSRKTDINNMSEDEWNKI